MGQETRGLQHTICCALSSQRACPHMGEVHQIGQSPAIRPTVALKRLPTGVNCVQFLGNCNQLTANRRQHQPPTWNLGLSELPRKTKLPENLDA